MASQPDIVLILADDMGFSDLGCYGGEADTPWLDRLGRNGTRFTQFYNSPRCSPSRASLLTGLYPHQVGVGILNFDDTPEGYPGNLSECSVTAAEALRSAGYATYASGKWHLASNITEPNSAWPTRRGFDHFFGTLDGAGSYFQPHTLTRDEQNIEHEVLHEDFFYTDAISETAVGYIQQHHHEQSDRPFFLYLAYTAPHWPLHARDEDIAKYRGRFDKGWRRLRDERLARLIGEDIVEVGSPLSDQDPLIPDWESVDNPEWEARRMEVYAAQIDRMDQGIGRVLTKLEELGRLDNTIVIFLSDNGGCAEEMGAGEVADFVTGFGLPLPERTRQGEPVVPGSQPGLMPGPESTYQSYGRPWANVSNTPFREYKHWVHEGGISTPFIVHWPSGLEGGGMYRQPAHLPDVLPTLLEAAGATHPRQRNGHDVPPPEGRSLLPSLRGKPAEQRALFWEHEGNAGVRRGPWKLVRKYGRSWELYDIDADRAERNDLATQHPQVVAELAAAYEEWAHRCGVIPRARVLELYRQRGRGLPQC